MKRWIHSSIEVTASEIVNNGKIQKGLVWYRDGFTKQVVSVSKDGKTCKVSEDWINEDTGKPMHKVYTYKIDQDDNGDEFCYDPKYEEYAFNDRDPEGYSWWARNYATGADNYPYASPEEHEPDENGWYSDDPDEWDDDDDYTPSATRGDYGPSNPWDAPGMSVRDFI